MRSPGDFVEEPGSERIMLVALTGYGTPEAVERSRQAGFDHHLIKPVNAEALQEIMRGEERAGADGASGAGAGPGGTGAVSSNGGAASMSAAASGNGAGAGRAVGVRL